MLTLVGLKTCDTCRKAKKWLEAEGLEFTYRDVRADGLAREDVERWVEAVGWETLLNRRGTTWRGLSDAEKDGIDAAKAVDVILAHPAVMKRPVFLKGETVIVGFKAEQQALLQEG